MPNWCHNRVTIYTNDKHPNLDYIRELFNSPQPFDILIPEPEWSKVPNADGVLPELHPVGDLGYVWQWPDGTQDDRWYSWRNQNWGTKWDLRPYKITWNVDDEDMIQITFETAWGPAVGICKTLRDKGYYIEWFYDEPGIPSAGYL